MTQQLNFQQNVKIYLLAFALSLWGVFNIFYWEVYKGYPACLICKWHRALYLGLFFVLLMLFKWKKYFLKLLVLLLLTAEMAVSSVQVLNLFCDPLVCRRVSTGDKLNLLFVIAVWVITVGFELIAYLKRIKL